VPTGLGAILPELRAERDLPRGEAALYPSGFALGLVVVGPVGPAWCGGAARRRGPGEQYRVSPCRKGLSSRFLTRFSIEWKSGLRECGADHNAGAACPSPDSC